jgi:hypothetical protein
MVHANVHLKAILRVGLGRVAHACGTHMQKLSQYLITYIRKILMEGENISVFHYWEQNSYFTLAFYVILRTALTSMYMYRK